ncbi:energy transducer TonB [Dyella silvae]|uniref:energy transducer TonB n=1 Tax=Dyella silvae TaxID=2994424 RepID=UPI0022655258|nr:energy transducer TonB [Dyella silvae]
MNRFAAGAAAAALMLTHAVLAADKVPNDWKRSALYVTGVADIDSQGKVERIELLPVEDKGGTELAAQLAPLAKSTMSHWEFEPATENGKPAAAHTFLHGVFEFRPQGSSYEARLVFIGNGPRLERDRSPSYPSQMVSDRVQALLTMLVLVQPDGSLSDIHLESAQSTGGQRVGQFVRAATEAISSWHAEPEMVDGHPVKTWVRVPVSFDLRDSVSKLQYAPELKRSVDSPAEPTKHPIGDQSVALDSPIKMRPQSP